MAEFEKVADSGSRQDFTTGAIRDIQESKTRPDLISPVFLRGLTNETVSSKLSLKDYVYILTENIENYGEKHNVNVLLTAAKALMFILHFQETLTYWADEDVISPVFIRRLGYWLMLGAKKYKERNWELGINLSRSYTSLCRHRDQWLLNDSNEDHAAAMLCNLMFIYHTKVMIDRGILPEILDDFPKYEK